MSRNLQDIFTVSLERIALADPNLPSLKTASGGAGARLVEARTALSEAAWYLKTAKGKYDHIDFKPPKSVANEAERGLDYRKKQKGDKAGLSTEEASAQGIGSGVQRAVNLKNRDTMSPSTVKRMYNFFNRHEKNKAIDAKHKGTPWKDKGYVAWLLWGGDSGRSWANKIVKQMEAADEKAKKKASLRNVFRTASDNEPTDPKLWSRAQAQAKKKFTKHPSAYSNGWAVKWYNDKGGGWRKKD